MRLKNTATVLLMLLIVNVSYAAGLVISPFRANLSATQTSAVFNVANQRETPMVVQVNTVEWLQQASGEDVFNDTQDIIATPAIVTIGKSSHENFHFSCYFLLSYTWLINPV